MVKQADLAQAVVKESGKTLASEAGITMADKPAALSQLLVLVNLVSARISARIAKDAARAINDAGGTTPDGMAPRSRQEAVDAPGRGHDVREDERTATRHGACGAEVREEYQGDLRRIAEDRTRTRLSSALQTFPGIGPTGAAIFCREAQAVWPWLRPYTDKLARTGAERIGLPKDEDKLGELVEGDDMAAFAAGRTHAARDEDLADRIRHAVE